MQKQIWNEGGQAWWLLYKILWLKDAHNAKRKSCTIFTKCNNQRSKEGTFSFLREQSQDWWSGCTNVGIIKNFLSIQIQEQEQGARSMCFQTWSNKKKIAFISKCKRIAVKIRWKNTNSLISLPYICLHYISGQQCKQCKQPIAGCYLHLWWYSLYISSEFLIISYNILLGPWWMFRGIINLRLFWQIWEAIRVYFSPPISPRGTFFAKFILPIFTKIWEAIRLYRDQ